MLWLTTTTVISLIFLTILRFAGLSWAHLSLFLLCLYDWMALGWEVWWSMVAVN